MLRYLNESDGIVMLPSQSQSIHFNVVLYFAVTNFCVPQKQ